MRDWDTRGNCIDPRRQPPHHAFGVVTVGLRCSTKPGRSYECPMLSPREVLQSTVKWTRAHLLKRLPTIFRSEHWMIRWLLIIDEGKRTNWKCKVRALLCTARPGSPVCFERAPPRASAILFGLSEVPLALSLEGLSRKSSLVSKTRKVAQVGSTIPSKEHVSHTCHKVLAFLLINHHSSSRRILSDTWYVPKVNLSDTRQDIFGLQAI